MDKLKNYLNNPKYVFHGSNLRFDTVIPSRTIRMDQLRNVIYDGVSVHATPELYIALSYTYNRGGRPCYLTGVSLYENDNTIKILGKESLEHSLDVLWPKEYYGYIYVMEADQFHWQKGLGPLEVISLEPVNPVKIFKIKNIPKLLKKLDTEFVYRENTMCK